MQGYGAHLSLLNLKSSLRQICNKTLFFPYGQKQANLIHGIRHGGGDLAKTSEGGLENFLKLEGD